MGTKTYAVGADATLKGITEVTRGTVPSTGYTQLFYRPGADLDSERPIGFDPLLGQGRNVSGAFYEAINVAGNIPVPLDVRALGFWLHGLFGDATVTQVAATGEITFSAQPAADSTITINGVTWTFKASGASGDETDIGVDLAATLTALASDLNGSADTDIDDATYTENGTVLTVTYDTVGTGGNSFALAASAASNGTASAATLLGGGYSHEWDSGGEVPSKTLEIGHAQLVSPRFYRFPLSGFNELTFDMQRTGPANGQVGILAQRRDPKSSATIDASPTTHALTRFSSGRGSIFLGGSQLAGVTAGSFSYLNSLAGVETIRADGLIEEWISGEVRASGQMTVVSGTDTTIEDSVDSETPVALQYAFSHPLRWSLTFDLPRTFLPKAKAPISDIGLVTQDFQWEAENDESSGYTMQTTLVNDVALYD